MKTKCLLFLACFTVGCVAVFDHYKNFAPVIGAASSLESVRSIYPTNAVYSFDRIEWKGNETNRVYRRIVVDCEGTNPGHLLDNTASYLEPIVQYHIDRTANGDTLWGVECFCTKENKVIFDDFTRQYAIGQLAFDQAKELSPEQVWYVYEGTNILSTLSQCRYGHDGLNLHLSGSNCKPREWNCVVFNSTKYPQLKVCYTYYQTNLVSVMVHDRQVKSVMPTEKQQPEIDYVDMSPFKIIKRRLVSQTDVDLWWKTNTLSSGEIKLKVYQINTNMASRVKSYDQRWAALIHGLFPSGGISVSDMRWPVSGRLLFYRAKNGGVSMWTGIEDFGAVTVEKTMAVMIDYETISDEKMVSVPILGSPPRSLNDFLVKYHNHGISLVSFTADFNKLVLDVKGNHYLFVFNTLSKVLLRGFSVPREALNEFADTPFFYRNFEYYPKTPATTNMCKSIAVEGKT